MKRPLSAHERASLYVIALCGIVWLVWALAGFHQ